MIRGRDGDRGEDRPRRLHVEARALDRGLVAEVVGHLLRDGIIAYPTATLYGFGCALRRTALDRLAALKGRAEQRPFLLLVSSRQQVAGLDWTPEATRLAEAFWPGALTLVLRDRRGRYLPHVRGPSGGVAVRETPHPLPQAIIDHLGGPITSTSANPPGATPASSGDEAYRAALDLGAGSSVWVLDAGPLPPSEPSTLVDCTGAHPVVLRPGAVPVDRLRKVVPEIEPVGQGA